MSPYPTTRLRLAWPDGTSVLDHREVFKVQRKGTDEYRALSRAQFEAHPSDLTFEGVDGDEESNTVTYWYHIRTQDDEG